jgi:hypothetical protein
MKVVVKAFIPTFILFSVFARVTALDDLHRNMQGELKSFSLQSLMFYFSYCAPLLYGVLFLTQLLIIVPFWNRFFNKLKIFLPVLGASLLFSLAIGYIAWNPVNGYVNMLVSMATLFNIQAIYWVLNLMILYLLDRFTILSAQSTTTIA